MLYQFKYQTPDGFNDLLMRSDGESLVGLWFENSVDAKKNILHCAEKDLPIFCETCRWLDEYFSGRQPDFTPRYTIENQTSFRREVLDIVSDIPFGKTITYGEIAARIAEKHGIEKYPFGTDGELTLICEKRNSSEEKPNVTIKSNVPVTVEIIWGDNKEISDI